MITINKNISKIKLVTVTVSIYLSLNNINLGTIKLNNNVCRHFGYFLFNKRYKRWKQAYTKGTLDKSVKKQ